MLIQFPKLYSYSKLTSQQVLQFIRIVLRSAQTQNGGMLNIGGIKLKNRTLIVMVCVLKQLIALCLLLWESMYTLSQLLDCSVHCFPLANQQLTITNCIQIAEEGQVSGQTTISKQLWNSRDITKEHNTGLGQTYNSKVCIGPLTRPTV